jgi:uroporphyrinogen-III synthase
MICRVLVTRSEPGASETAARLKTLGYLPIVEPLFAVEAICVSLPAFDALAFTSANGVRVFAGLSPRRDGPVFCVGARTADAARAAGFTQVQSADGDVAKLAALIETNLPPSAAVLHAGNEESRGNLAGMLSANGRRAAFVAIYRAAPVPAPGPALAQHLGGRPAFEAVLVHSPRGGEVLRGLFAAAHFPAPLDAAAISPAAAAPLAGLARRTGIALAPNEAALLQALKGLSDLS